MDFVLNLHKHQDEKDFVWGVYKLTVVCGAWFRAKEPFKWLNLRQKGKRRLRKLANAAVRS